MRESRLLDHVTGTSAHPPHVVVPPGDDLAAVAVTSGPVLLGVDQVVEGRHFDRRSASLDAVGWKAVARCVSDVAAMAGRPTACLAAVVLPRDFGEAAARGLFDAVRRAADALDAPLVGGDIAIHAGPEGPLVLSISVLGETGPAGPVLRSGARPGDHLVVTGRLGGSLEAGGGGRHLAVEPRVSAGLDLARQLGDRLRALIDLSDGLGRDAGRMARASGVAMELDGGRIPRHEGATLEQAIGDGEDYELLAAVAGDPPTHAAGVPCTVIGRVVAALPGKVGSVRLRSRDGGEWIEVGERGWDHRGGSDADGADEDPRKTRS